jgi:LEA14-like dessication related protein
MRKTSFFLLLLTTAILLAACGGKQPQINIEPIETDWGHVVNGDILSRDVTVHNDGAAPLVVESVSTSCSCTTAELTPMTIEPGGTGTLHIEFDSGAHGPDLTGELVRQVFVTSNDPEQPEVVIEFSVVVNPKSG